MHDASPRLFADRIGRLGLFVRRDRKRLFGEIQALRPEVGVAHRWSYRFGRGPDGVDARKEPGVRPTDAAAAEQPVSSAPRKKRLIARVEQIGSAHVGHLPQ